MTTSYIISQICVVVAMILLGITYLVKDKKIVLILAILFASLYGVQYLLLNAISGFLMNIVSIIRNIWFYINVKKKKKNNIIVLISLSVIAIVFGLMSFKDIFSLLPIIATILYTYSIWQDEIKIYRWLAIPTSISWIIYNTYTNSIFAIISESILLIIEIIGIVKLYKSKK